MLCNVAVRWSSHHGLFAELMLPYVDKKKTHTHTHLKNNNSQRLKIHLFAEEASWTSAKPIQHIAPVNTECEWMQQRTGSFLIQILKKYKKTPKNIKAVNLPTPYFSFSVGIHMFTVGAFKWAVGIAAKSRVWVLCNAFYWRAFLRSVVGVIV